MPRSSRWVAKERKVPQKGPDFRLGHIPRVVLSMKQDEAFDPTEIPLLGAHAVVAYPDGVADLIQERRPPVPASHVRLQPGPNTVCIRSIVCDPNKQATADISLRCPTPCPSWPSAGPMSFGLSKAPALRYSPLQGKCGNRDGGARLLQRGTFPPTRCYVWKALRSVT